LVEDDLNASFAKGLFRSEYPAQDREISKRVRDWVGDEFKVELTE